MLAEIRTDIDLSELRITIWKITSKFQTMIEMKEDTGRVPADPGTTAVEPVRAPMINS
jgi:hypothetical protein